MASKSTNYYNSNADALKIKRKYQREYNKKPSEIKKVKFNDSFEQKECPIMMVEFEEGEEISELPCKHVFNTEAINRWLKEENYT